MPMAAAAEQIVIDGRVDHGVEGLPMNTGISAAPAAFPIAPTTMITIQILLRSTCAQHPARGVVAARGRPFEFDGEFGLHDCW